MRNLALALPPIRQLLTHRDALLVERDSLLVEREGLRGEHDALRGEHANAPMYRVGEMLRLRPEHKVLSGVTYLLNQPR